ncbi:aminodeoxychorismate synthase component I [Corynebacterium sp. LK2510]|uniref:aminodeoxychorismate synthase component I n=1 Tax=Corynebacterium sp. LK2510 TaxID=3110472 RepID=UPI0034CE488F
MILLVDNRDSYTHNLAHLIASAAGSAPLVVRADDVAALGIDSRVRGGEFTHVVISPGPGTPASPADFAGSRLVIEAASDLPVLGVCLGHQGLALLAGGSIGATQPHHGQVSTITHSGQGIFNGLPQGFAAVRYHSLRVAEPTEPHRIEVHARSEDGVIQALRIAGTNHWGVQFHPESVLSDHGEQLIRNFLGLASLSDASDAPASTSPRAKRTPRTTWRVLHRSESIDLDCERTIAELRDAAPDSDVFWLDSATGEGFSILGTTRGSQARTLSYRLGDAGPDILAQLDAQLDDAIDTTGVPALPFIGGWLGYLGYECAALTLPGFRPSHQAEGPDAYFVRPQAFVVYDHSASVAHCLALHDAAESDAEAIALVDELRGCLRCVVKHAPGEAADPASLMPGSWRMTRAEYRDRFDRIKTALARGDSYEVCLTDAVSTHCESDAAADGFSVYRSLRRGNPAPYAAYLSFGAREILCSSPERFLTVRGRRVETKPIKGTISRSAEPHSLYDDPKTRAENLMIVDLVRNDLGRVCEFGSVAVPKLMAVESFATVHQLVSTVTGTLRRDVSLVDLIRATFPGGSMTGAPKERTCAIIDELEAGPRGVYSGTIGYLGFDGSADLNIVIRTAVKDGRTLTVGAGGAIVWDSEADAEYAEMHLKADAVLAALSGPAPGMPSPGATQ